MKNIYENGTYLKNNPNWHQHESPWKAKQVIKALKRHNLKPSSICEVGCGAGETLKILSEQLAGDITYAGYDISPDAYGICSKKSKENLQFYLKDLLEEEVAFDIVMALDVIEHIEDERTFLIEIVNNHLDSGGYLLITVPAFNFLYSSHDRFLGHYRRYNLKELVCLINGVYLEPVSYGYLFFP